MRVALVVNQFPSAEHPYIFDWVQRMLASGLDLTVIAERATPLSSEFDSQRGGASRIRKLNLIDAPELGLFLHSLFAALRHPRALLDLYRTLHRSESGRLRTVCRKLFEYLPFVGERFDLVHFNAPQLAVRRFEMKDIFHAASLVSFRGQDFSFYSDRYDGLLRDADHLHFISGHQVGQARERGYDGSRHTLIPPMVDVDFYVPKPSTAADHSGPFTIFTAARFEWVKGWEFALQAVALLLQRGWDVEYFIAGDGALKDLLLYTIDQLGIGAHVHLLGWQSPEQVRARMQDSHLYLLTSVDEAFNNSVLQAQACGLPVVCSDQGGLPENIADGVSGLLARCRDAWDTADKMEILLRDGERRMRMSAASPGRIREHYSIDQGARDFIDLYQGLAG